MSRNALGVLAIFGLLFALSSTVAYQPAEPVRNHLPDPFAVGWILNDTNGDGVVDFIAGKVVVPEHPTADGERGRSRYRRAPGICHDRIHSACRDLRSR